MHLTKKPAHPFPSHLQTGNDDYGTYQVCSEGSNEFILQVAMHSASVSPGHCYHCCSSCYCCIDIKVSLLVKLSSEKLCISDNSLGHFKDN